MKVYDYECNGHSFLTDEQTVLDHWKDEFCELYDMPVYEFHVNENFRRFILNETQLLEQEMESCDFESNRLLNQTISHVEVEKSYWCSEK